MKKTGIRKAGKQEKNFCFASSFLRSCVPDSFPISTTQTTQLKKYGS
jgi:hypothetical protein